MISLIPLHPMVKLTTHCAVSRNYAPDQLMAHLKLVPPRLLRVRADAFGVRIVSPQRRQKSVRYPPLRSEAQSQSSQLIMR